MKYTAHLALILIVLVKIFNLSGAVELENIRHARIIGANNLTEMNPLNSSFIVAIYEFKHIYGSSYFKCAGSLIGPRTVLTAAQCCQTIDGGVLAVRFDGNVLNNLEQFRVVRNTQIHPKYNPNNQAYGFCVLTLEGPPVNKSSTVNFIEIAKYTPLNGTSTIMLGWGQYMQDQIIPSQPLEYLEMKILSSRECQKKFQNSSQDSISIESQICATSSSGSACFGDQGAPLVYKDKLVGVELRPRQSDPDTILCPNDASTQPNVFGDNVRVRDWILDKIE